MIKLDSDERIVLRIHRHWFILLTQALPLILLLFLPILVRGGLSLTGIAPLFSLGEHPQKLVTLLSAAWALFMWVTLFLVWTDYYLDVLVVTNKRVIDIEQKGIFSREVAAFRLDRIQDVTVNISGVIATFLEFGNIHIQTAGETADIIVRGIPNPHRVRETISRLQDAEVERVRAGMGGVNG